jgi:SM-20-related protein
MVLALRKHTLELFCKNKMKQASVGERAKNKKSKDTRGDSIHWIDDWSQTPSLLTYKNFIDSFMNFLRKDLYLVCKSFEAHLSHYPNGALYKKHLDQHRLSKHRQISCLFYFGDWSAGNGGELKLYLPNSKEVTLSPSAGRFVCFYSGQTPHEVLITLKNRYALSGWIRDDL